MDMDYGELSHSVVTIFKQRPGLESYGFSDPEIHCEGRAMRVIIIARKNLKDLSLASPIPRELVSTIARHHEM